MSKEEEIKSILEILATSPQGAGTDKIKQEVGIELRTLQRRLAHLVKSGLIKVSGNTRARLYHLVNVSDNKAVDNKNRDSNILQGDAKQVFELISMPLENRGRVTYNRNFLDLYQPNDPGLSYLNIEDKRILRGMGTTQLPN